MATAARSPVLVYLEMIKIEHSIFALPFALIGMMWGSVSQSGVAWPGYEKLAWILLAMVSCRSAAMAFNRIADRHIDAKNPRTSMRALPAGLLKLGHANLFFAISCMVFFLAAAMLNGLAFALSPVALGVTLVYSLSKRFTWLCHFILGLSLGIAPAAAWIGVTGSLHSAILPIVFGVMFWTAGFDIIYALQDEGFDRENRLHSLPARFGKSVSLLVSRACHVLAVVCLALGGWFFGAGAFWYAGVGLAAALLVYEQSLVKPNDLSKVDMAFFTLNGYVGIGLFAAALADTLL